MQLYFFLQFATCTYNYPADDYMKERIAKSHGLVRVMLLRGLGICPNKPICPNLP